MAAAMRVEPPRAARSATARGARIGVDIGGSGIKAAAVDLDTGELLSPRHRVPTPQPSAPAAVIASINDTGVPSLIDDRATTSRSA